MRISLAKCAQIYAEKFCARGGSSYILVSTDAVTTEFVALSREATDRQKGFSGYGCQFAVNI